MILGELVGVLIIEVSGEEGQFSVLRCTVGHFDMLRHISISEDYNEWRADEEIVIDRLDEWQESVSRYLTLTD